MQEARERALADPLRDEVKRAGPKIFFYFDSNLVRTKNVRNSGVRKVRKLESLQGSFSAVSKPIFASTYSLESSRRDLHNALLCTVLVGSVWVREPLSESVEEHRGKKQQKFQQFLTKILRLESGAKECIV